MNNLKINWIITAQIIGCILVVYGHSYHVPPELEIPLFWRRIHQFVYSFHMPLFVFVSGYLFGFQTNIKDYNSKMYIKKRAVKLLIPYFVLSLFAFLPKIITSYHFTIHDEVPNSIDLVYILQSFFSPRDSVWGHFWFLPLLFFLQIIGLVLYKLTKNLRIYFLSLLFTFPLLYIDNITSWFSVNDICRFLFWYLLGFTSAKIQFPNATLFNIKNLSLRFYWIFIFSAITIFVISGMQQRTPLTPLVAILMILFCICLCKNKHLENLQPFRALNGLTYSVFILSWPVQAVVDIVFNQIIYTKLSYIHTYIHTTYTYQ
jgi:fucose 4-O-acetylase-like acetyltransferase